MRESVLKLNLKISVGINSGFMYVGKIGVDEHIEYSAYGPEINLAKRLQDTAEPGRILVGLGTYRFTRKAFEFQPVGPFHLKGIDTPTTAYELLGQTTHPEKLRGIDGLQSHFIGRDREFSVLTECAEAWLSGVGQMVSIIGEAGIGKSRMVRELREYLEKVKAGELESQKTGVAIMEGRCLSIGQPVSYWPFLDILRSYFNLTEDDNEREIGTKISESITGLFPTRGFLHIPPKKYISGIKQSDCAS